MDFTPAPSVIFTIFSLFRKPAPQPTFAPAILPMHVHITRDTTTHIDPPVVLSSNTSPLSASEDKKRTRPLSLHVVTNLSELMTQQRQHSYPETPRAPNAHRTTFILGPAKFDCGDELYCDDQASFCEVDLDVPPGLARICHPTEPKGHTTIEPRTLAKALFFFGFVFPAFWVVGSAIMVIPLRTTTDWEAGRNSMEIKWGRSVIRETEIRWARRCFAALLLEVLLGIIVVVIVKWGIKA